MKIIDEYNAELEILESYLHQRVSQGEILQILEAGCGREWYFRMEGIAYELTGVDMDRLALEARRQSKGDLTYCIVGDLRTATLEPNKYDVIYNAFVLEHVRGAEQVLGKLCPVAATRRDSDSSRSGSQRRTRVSGASHASLGTRALLSLGVANEGRWKARLRSLSDNLRQSCFYLGSSPVLRETRLDHQGRTRRRLLPAWVRDHTQVNANSCAINRLVDPWENSWRLRGSHHYRRENGLIFRSLRTRTRNEYDYRHC